VTSYTRYHQQHYAILFLVPSQIHLRDSTTTNATITNSMNYAGDPTRSISYTSQSSFLRGQSPSNNDHNNSQHQHSFFTVSWILYQRSFTNLIRQPVLFFNRITQCLFYALILACYYAPVNQTTQESIQNRIGLLYELTAVNFIGMLNCIAMFPNERNIFYREIFDGYYSALAFIMAYYSIALPLMVASALALALVATWSTGLVITFIQMLQMTYICFCYILTGESIGVIFCILFQEIGFAVNVMSAILSVFGIMSGFISLDMPKVLQDISRIWPISWGAYLSANVAFEDTTFKCDGSETNNYYYYSSTSNSTSTCTLQTGDDVLSLYGFTSSNPQLNMNFHYIMIAVIASCYFLISLIAVKWRAWKLLGQ
jgi:hypothetical protein